MVAGPVFVFGVARPVWGFGVAYIEQSACERLIVDDQVKQLVKKMRIHGASTAVIAKHLVLNPNSVKTLCRRQGWAPDACFEQVSDPRGVWCRQCGEKIMVGMGMKRRWFCCQECRRVWWKNHPEESRRKAFYHFTCCCCGRGFVAYGNVKRKYCTHACYIRDRFHRAGEVG